jgi:hypothetical protein
MLRAGFFFGFLVGAGVASLFSGDRRQAPGSALSAEAPQDDTSFKGKLRAAFQEARAAARQAADRKEHELMWQFEMAIRRRPDELPPLGR